MKGFKNIVNERRIELVNERMNELVNERRIKVVNERINELVNIQYDSLKVSLISTLDPII